MMTGINQNFTQYIKPVEADTQGYFGKGEWRSFWLSAPLSLLPTHSRPVRSHESEVGHFIARRVVKFRFRIWVTLCLTWNY